MTKKQAIHRAISTVLEHEGRPLTADEIHSLIIERELYSFPAKDPVGVVRNTLRRHCVDLDFATANKQKYFSRDVNQRYSLLPNSVVASPTVVPIVRKGKNKLETVAIPTDQDEQPALANDSKHTEIQWRLIDLGLKLGMNVWAPKNDRGMSWSGGSVADFASLLKELPPQFEPAAMKTIEYIDVIWLDNKSIVAAFEVEHSTPIYSGLLRMADLMTLVPNQDINWYVVSAEHRFDKFSREVNRPVFKRALKRPLYKVCRFLSYEKLLIRLEAARDVLGDLKPSFIERIGEFYVPDEDCL